MDVSAIEMFYWIMIVMMIMIISGMVKSFKYLSGNYQKRCLNIPKKFRKISKNPLNVSKYLVFLF